MARDMIARLLEYEFYDPLKDMTMLRLMITEARGTWFADIPALKTRERKQAFQAHVKQAIELGHEPRQVEL